jgi:RNAse (barnase) inhibitor barstar
MIELCSDAGRSGVYRTNDAERLLAAAAAQGLCVARIASTGPADKRSLLRAFAAALRFPDWFGGNWDALEDCLTDLSWIPAPGYLILIEGWDRLAQDDHEVLREVLASAAQFWSDRGTPYFAVFMPGPATLPEIGVPAQA